MGSATAIKTAMIAITIISSMKVNPKRRRFVTASPLGIGSSIARLIHALGVHIEYVLPAPGLRRRIVTVASQAPVVGVRHGILGNAAQVFVLLVYRSGRFDSVYELL